MKDFFRNKKKFLLVVMLMVVTLTGCSVPRGQNGKTYVNSIYTNNDVQVKRGDVDIPDDKELQKKYKDYKADDLITIEAGEKLNESLALFLADDSEKQLLENLVDAICDKIKKHIAVVPRVSKTMVGVESAEKILSWIEDNEINMIAYSINELLSYVVELFNTIYIDEILDIKMCQKWTKGESYKEISESMEIPVLDVEKKCGQSISYQLSFLIGNIIDYLETESVNLEMLKMLQKKVKYGVDTETAIAICEKIFNDRIIANFIASEIGDSYLGEEEIINVIKYKKDEIKTLLEPFPTYFSERVSLLTK